MIVAASALLVLAYALAASWAVSRSPRCLWQTAAATLGLIALAAIVLGRHYSVPSPARLLLVTMAFVGPAVVAPTVLLSVSSAPGSACAGRLAMAVLGGCAGAIGGLFLVVFGFGVW